MQVFDEVLCVQQVRIGLEPLDGVIDLNSIGNIAGDPFGESVAVLIGEFQLDLIILVPFADQ